MSVMYCGICLDVMKPLFSGYFCPNDCDRKCDLPPAGWKCTLLRGHAGPCPTKPQGAMGPFGRAMFKQSWLWRPNAGPARGRVLSCPYCSTGTLNVHLTCGIEKEHEGKRYFSATCQGPDCHQLTVENDEDF